MPAQVVANLGPEISMSQQPNRNSIKKKKKHNKTPKSRRQHKQKQVISESHESIQP